MYMNELFPVVVSRVGSKPLFDPDDTRMKSEGTGRRGAVNVLVCGKRAPAPGRASTSPPTGSPSTRRSSGSRRVRTRSAPSRLPSSSSSSTAVGRPCSRSGRRRPRSSCATPSASGSTRRCWCRPTGPTGTRSARRGRSSAAIGRLESEGTPVRPHPVRQRVGRLRGVPGRHPRRPGARPAGRQRRQGARRSPTTPVRVERETDAGRVVFDLPMPAVVGVKEGINLPRYPTMKGRLASKKVAVDDDRVRRAPGGQRLAVAAATA